LTDVPDYLRTFPEKATTLMQGGKRRVLLLFPASKRAKQRLEKEEAELVKFPALTITAW
jgi:hypothetical protein